jgi:hypothetical protein
MYSQEQVMVQQILSMPRLSASELGLAGVAFRKAMLLVGGGRLKILRISLRWVGLARSADGDITNSSLPRLC